MSHYTIRYTNSQAVNDAAALADIIEYLGPNLWDKLVDLFIRPRFDLSRFGQRRELVRSVRFACVMVGVQGYPAEALVRHVFASQRDN